ncbi:MAG: DUF1648 domain-containing protein [Methanomassiliicoccaceae archaeon]|jgi:uncharacterized membrane protein|nr:DUF1648 domain-containing protein [Methanomassiliicoccaceae archaeon]
MPAKIVTRTHYVLLFILAIMPLLITLVALQFLPDQIPAHYNSAGEVDRWGSKYESLFLPIMAVAMGLFLIWMTKFSAAKDDYVGRLVMYVSSGTALALLILTAVLLYISFTNV